MAGCSILVTSYTNSAVDNILIKLIEEMQQQGDGREATSAASHEHPFVDLGFLRLGNAHAVHPSVRPFLPGGARCVSNYQPNHVTTQTQKIAKVVTHLSGSFTHPPIPPLAFRHPYSSASELSSLADSARLVATTCLSCRHPLLSRGRTFDVVLVDEASQISLPAIIGPLCLGRSFLLVRCPHPTCQQGLLQPESHTYPHTHLMPRIPVIYPYFLSDPLLLLALIIHQVGDHYQLSPLVTSKAAQEGGLGTSLFRILSEAAPQVCQSFTPPIHTFCHRRHHRSIRHEHLLSASECLRLFKLYLELFTYWY